MDEQIFLFVRECPQLKQLIHAILDLDMATKDRVYALVEIAYCNGVTNGIDRTLREHQAGTLCKPTKPSTNSCASLNTSFVLVNPKG